MEDLLITNETLDNISGNILSDILPDEYIITNRELINNNRIITNNNNIINNMIVRELNYMVDWCKIVKKQDGNVKPHHRYLLVDWMFDICTCLLVRPETYFLSVYIVDKVLELRKISLKYYQLVGIAGILIAYKYEENYDSHISLKYLVYTTNHTYTKYELLKAERVILKTLGYKLNYPSSYYFLCNHPDYYKFNKVGKMFSKYICELSTIDKNTLQYLPSEIVEASIYLTKKYFNYENKIEISENIIECSKLLNKIHTDNNKNDQLSIIEKYREFIYCSVAYIEPIEHIF